MTQFKGRKSDATRQKIIRAFNECVASSGYAQTKLVDIAEAAGLATPHLRYYFKNRESILEYQYEQLVAAFGRSVAAIDAASPMGWFEALGHLLFDTERRSSEALIVLIEANSLAARSERMRKLKTQYDRQTLGAIEAQLSTLEDGAADAAQMIFHFLTGLILNTAFEAKRKREAAIPLLLEFVAGVMEQGHRGQHRGQGQVPGSSAKVKAT